MCDENQIGVIQLYWAHKAVLVNLLQNKCIKSGKCLQHIQQKNKNIQNRKSFLKLFLEFIVKLRALLQKAKIKLRV